MYILLFIIICLFVSCETKDGSMINEDALRFQSCETDFDCGKGRFCDESRKCSIECRNSKDCNYKYSDSTASYECSPCGRCIKIGEIDKRCIIASDIPCYSDKDCIEDEKYNSSGYGCVDGFCTLRCKKDEYCKRLGTGYSCNTENGFCYRKCFRDNDCYFHGWQYQCLLPEGIDKTQNELMPPGQEIYGKCVPRIGGIDWGNENNHLFPAHSYQGIWGFSINAAITIKNVPFINVQNTVLKSLLLVKILQNNQDIEIYNKWCYLEFENFDDNNPDYEDIAKIVIPENYILNMPIAKTFAKNPPELSYGNSFITDRIFILYGARLDDPFLDPLPDRENSINQFDDDRDLKPGVTVYLTGIINGEIYSVQRFWINLNINIINENALYGLIDFKNELSFIGTKPEYLYYKPYIEKYSKPERSYFRAKRLNDSASCKDLIEIAKSGWLKLEPFYNESARP